MYTMIFLLQPTKSPNPELEFALLVERLKSEIAFQSIDNVVESRTKPMIVTLREDDGNHFIMLSSMLGAVFLGHFTGPHRLL